MEELLFPCDFYALKYGKVIVSKEYRQRTVLKLTHDYTFQQVEFRSGLRFYLTFFNLNVPTIGKIIYCKLYMVNGNWMIFITILVIVFGLL